MHRACRLPTICFASPTAGIPMTEIYCSLRCAHVACPATQIVHSGKHCAMRFALMPAQAQGSSPGTSGHRACWQRHVPWQICRHWLRGTACSCGTLQPATPSSANRSSAICTAESSAAFSCGGVTTLLLPLCHGYAYGCQEKVDPCSQALCDGRSWMQAADHLPALHCLCALF